MSSLAPTAPRRVLPTLNTDGSRRWLRPRPFTGRFFRARRAVALGLVLLFAALPWIDVGGHPALLLDIAAREFHVFGATFRATDGVVLMLLLLSIFVGIFLITAWLGRAWCGWACPQTVYMEFLFRPLERWIEGGLAAQKRIDQQGFSGRRLLKHGVFALLSVVLAHVFLSYFVGVERLATWVTRSPFEHPGGFLVVGVTAGLVFADFGFFREQMCTIACPYARLQSALLDSRSLVVGYDQARGEPRGRGAGRGDCVDCKACVVTCPTGIDIREGLQLECIACAQCVDACDSVMRKFKRAPGLIRYDAAHRFGAPRGSLAPRRVRVYVYAAALALLVTALVIFGRAAQRPEITVLRTQGAPFELRGARVQNQVRLKIQNRNSEASRFTLELEGAPEAELVLPENPIEVAAGELATTSVFVLVPASEFVRGSRSVRFVITDQRGDRYELPHRLLGPFKGDKS